MTRHIPVMLTEVLNALSPKDSGIYVDATFGNGGYSEAILNAADCKVIAIDRDPSVQKRAEELKQLYNSRFEFKLGTFSEINSLISERVNGVVFDIGVSSMQLDDGYRGFSFSKEAPLDMRMSMKGISAKDIVNTCSETELANILFTYGEETKSRQIAKRIIEYRINKEIETTTELAEIIYTVLPKRFGKIDPATKSFQALRIAVNDELEQLKEGLIGGANLLLSEGRIVVVDFHSLEDRIVKLFFRENSAPKEHVSRYKESLPLAPSNNKLFYFTSKALLASEEEIKINPRARSAKLRYAIKREEQNYE